jgi:hypothetical protein
MTKMAFVIVAIMVIAPVARAQELPDYPIRDDRDVYDFLATSWEEFSSAARQCALNRMRQRHITRAYINLLRALTSCQLDENADPGNK